MVKIQLAFLAALAANASAFSPLMQLVSRMSLRGWCYLTPCIALLLLTPNVVVHVLSFLRNRPPQNQNLGVVIF
jgi:hypothetical protein